MKNFLFILIPFLLFKINNCFAQKDTAAEKKFDRFYISLTGGIGIPVGEFSEFSIPNDPPAPISNFYNLAGEARTGYTGKLNAHYFFAKHFGCAASVFTGSFKAKDKTYQELFNSPSTLEYTTYTYKAESWTASGIMIGAIAGAPVSNFLFNIKFLAGFQRSVCPETNISLIDENVISQYTFTETIRQPAVSSTAFAWDAGIDIGIKTGKKIAVLFSADYSASKADFNGPVFIEAEFNDHTNGNYLSHYSESFPFDETKQIAYISLTVGIAYVFK